MDQPGYACIMASRRNGTLYLGVTSNLVKRTYEHRQGVVEGFTKTHGCKTLVWYEVHASIDDARLRELRMKSWHRGWKMKLIDAMNPEWVNLYPTLF